MWCARYSIRQTRLVCKLILDWNVNIFVVLTLCREVYKQKMLPAASLHAEMEGWLITVLLLFLLRSHSHWSYSQCFGGYYPRILHVWTGLHPYSIQDLHADVTLPGMWFYSALLQPITLRQGRFRLDIRKKSLHWKGYQALEQAAQGRGWVPGGI